MALAKGTQHSIDEFYVADEHSSRISFKKFFSNIEERQEMKWNMNYANHNTNFTVYCGHSSFLEETSHEQVPGNQRRFSQTGLSPLCRELYGQSTPGPVPTSVRKKKDMDGKK